MWRWFNSKTIRASWAAFSPVRIAAGALADPFTDYAKKLGYKEIADIAALGLEFPFVGIVAKKSYIKDNPDIAQRFVRAYTEAIALYKTNRELAMKVTSKYTGIKDPAILASTVEFLCPQVGAGALSNDRRHALRARADRDPGPEGQERQSGIVHGRALRQAARRQRLYPDALSERIAC